MIPKKVEALIAELKAEGSEHAEAGAVLDKITTYGDEMRRCFKMMEPGSFPTDDVRVRSIQISQREKDGRLFLTVRAETKLSRKTPDKIVCFASGREWDAMLYEILQKIWKGTAKWREDKPYEPENPHDRPEALPKWGD